MRGEILGLERRRRWSDEAKLSIVMSVGLDGVTVTQVAQRHEITRQQIYGWRRELRQKGMLPDRQVCEPRFVPVEMTALVDDRPAQSCDVMPARQKDVELQLGPARRLCFDSGMDVAVLTRLIRAVEAA